MVPRVWIEQTTSGFSVQCSYLSELPRHNGYRGVIRTHDTQNQNLLPYRLATRQYKQEAIFFWLFWLAVKSIKNKILLKSLFKNGADSGARSHNKCLEGTYVTSYTIPAAVAYASRARSCLLSFATIAALCGPRALNKFILASINFLFKSLFIILLSIHFSE